MSVLVRMLSTRKTISETLAAGCSFIMAVTGQSVSVRGVTLDSQSPHDQLQQPAFVL